MGVFAQGLSFEATALQGQAGHEGVVSPPHTSATAPDQDEEMLELPAGSRPPRIPRRSNRLHLHVHAVSTMHASRVIGCVLHVLEAGARCASHCRNALQKSNQQYVHPPGCVLVNPLWCMQSYLATLLVQERNGWLFCSSTITEGDVLVEEYSAEDYDADADYVVDFIVADRTKGKKKEYLVKWKVIYMLPHHLFVLCKLSYIVPRRECALPQMHKLFRYRATPDHVLLRYYQLDFCDCPASQPASKR